MMSNWRCCGWCGRECLIFSLAALAYFVVFPDDLRGLLAPIDPLVDTLKNVLSMSYSISLWLYILASVAVVAWVIVRVWGRSPTTAP